MEKLKDMTPGPGFKAGFILLLLVTVQILGTAAALQASTGKRNPDLVIKIEGLSSNKGMVRVAVYNRPEGFPGDRKKAVKVFSVPARKEGVQLVLEALAPGRYAVAVLHDENENGVMDTNFIGYPQEGYGMSNNNLPTFRAPTFDEAAFELGEAGQQLLIRIRN